MFLTLSIVLAAACLVPAVGKLSSHPKMLAAADHFQIAWPRYRLIGVAELGAAIGAVAGIAWPPLGIAAALGLLALLVGALVVHRRAGDAVREAAPALVGLAISVAYLIVAGTR